MELIWRNVRQNKSRPQEADKVNTFKCQIKIIYFFVTFHTGLELCLKHLSRSITIFPFATQPKSTENNPNMNNKRKIPAVSCKSVNINIITMFLK